MSRLEQSQAIWAEKAEGPSSLAGCANLGSGHEIGADYRHAEEWRIFCELVPLSPAWRAVELGAGNGRWLESLAPRVSECVGVDYSQAMLDLARERLASARIVNCKLVLGSVTDDLLESRFDLVYFSGCLQYLDDTDAVRGLKLAAEHLTSDGWLVDRTTVSLMSRVEGNREQRYSLYRTAAEHLDLFRQAGFELIDRRKSYSWLWLPRIMRHKPFDGWITAAARATAPYSWRALGALSRLHSRLLPKQHELEYSHDFFIFRRARD